MVSHAGSPAVSARTLPPALFTPFVTVLATWRGVMPLLVTGLLAAVIAEGDVESRRVVAWFAVVSVAVLVANLGVLSIVRRTGSRAWIGHPAALAGDVAVLAALLLLNAGVLPHQTALLEGRDVFNAYLWGVAALWTFLRSPWTGAGILVVGALVQAIGLVVNGYPPDALTTAKLWMRQVWGPVAVVLVGVMATIVNRAVAEQQEGARLRAEAARERAESAALARAHDEVLPLLSAIVRASEEGDGASARMVRIRRLAQQADDVVREGFERQGGAPGAVGAGVTRLVHACRERQREAVRPVRVRCSLSDVEPDVPVEGRGALLAAVEQAVRNAEQHAAAGCITVSVEVGDTEVRVVVADDGVGFDPALVGRDRFGVRGSIQQRLAGAGGHAALDTAPGQGCVWELSVPRTPATPPESGVGG